MKPNCKSCRFYEPEHQQCRVGEPKPVQHLEQGMMSLRFTFPIVDPTQWCGRFDPAPEPEPAESPGLRLHKALSARGLYVTNGQLDMMSRGAFHVYDAYEAVAQEMLGKGGQDG